MLERVFLIDLSVSTFIEPMVDFPRSIGYVAVLTRDLRRAVPLEKSRGRLVSVDPGSTDLTIDSSDGREAVDASSTF